MNNLGLKHPENICKSIGCPLKDYFHDCPQKGNCCLECKSSEDRCIINEENNFLIFIRKIALKEALKNELS